MHFVHILDVIEIRDPCFVQVFYIVIIAEIYIANQLQQSLTNYVYFSTLVKICLVSWATLAMGGRFQKGQTAGRG